MHYIAVICSFTYFAIVQMRSTYLTFGTITRMGNISVYREPIKHAVTYPKSDILSKIRYPTSNRVSYLKSCHLANTPKPTPASILTSFSPLPISLVQSHPRYYLCSALTHIPPWHCLSIHPLHSDTQPSSSYPISLYPATTPPHCTSVTYHHSPIPTPSLYQHLPTPV